MGPQTANVRLGDIELLDNPRKSMDTHAFRELCESITQHGVLVPVIVRPNDPDNSDFQYSLVAGTRRFKAAQQLALETIPAIIHSLEGDQLDVVQLIENLQREDLPPMEEAIAFQRLLELPGYDVAKVSAKTGKPKSYIYQRLALLNLGDAAKKALADGDILLGHARLLAGLQADDQKKALEGGCWGQRWDGKHTVQVLRPVDELEDWIDRHIHRNLKKACFDTEDATLLADAGPCSACPKRTGFIPELFPHVKDSDTCTDPACFEGKIGTHVLRLQEQHGAIRVTSAYHYSPPKKKPKDAPLSQGEWKLVAESKRNACSDVMPAVEMDPHSEHFGKLIYACTNKSCKAHSGRSRPTSSSRSETDEDRRRKAKQKAEKEKARVENEWRGRVVRGVLAAAPATAPSLDSRPLVILREVGASLIGRLHHDDKKTLCRWLELEPPTKKRSWGGVDTDYEGAITTWFNGSELFPALTVLCLVPNYSPCEKTDARLCGVAEALGVDHASILAELKKESVEKTAKAKERATARAKAEKKKASASKRSAKKATKATADAGKKKTRSSTKRSAAAK